ncbi:rhodanese-like domain-containing protein [Segetibacter koreensis]|uniref:rhodanese-like domain-containing protein n=1 Tax=Segetibacter koreensis TaxID=398037 RepID=UPI000365B109|nr:rhodanese-like domain-containing protein [Segetibacter koreensis]
MKELLNKGTLVDVRSPQEFAGKHFPNAINIPLDQVPQKVNEFKEMPKPIIAYCRSGNRSGMAVSILKQAGITDVINGGGLEDLLQQATN